MANEGIIKKQTNAVQRAGQPKTLNDYIKSMEGEIAKALPSVITPERFTRMVMSAVSTNRKLGDCEPMSFLAAMMNAAQLGLEPNTPLAQAYLIPYAGKVQFQLGYKGLIDLAYRSGEVEIVQAQCVYEHDDFEFEYGLNPVLKHKPAKGARGELICVYAMFKTKSGGYGFDVMSAEDIRAHAKKYSKAYSSEPWQTNFEEMAKKTVLKRVLKYAPLKSDIMRAVASDNTIKHQISDDMFEVNSDAPDPIPVEVAEQPESGTADDDFAAIIEG